MLRHRGNPLDSQSFKPATLDKKSKTVEDKERKERRELVKRNLISTLQAFYEYDDALTEYQKEFGSVYDKEVLKAAKDYMLQIFSYGVSNDSEYTIAKFEQLCDIFGFSKRWQEDPALVEAVKNIFLYQIEGCNYSAYKLKKSMAVFSDPVIFNNEEIRQAIATQMLQGELNLSERFKILVDWGLPTEALKEHAILKATDLLSASQGYDRGLESRGLNYLISCVDVWPDFLTFSGLQDAVLTSIDSLSSGETLVNYFSTTTNVFENLEERLKLPADFVLRWKKKAVRKIITYSNANASRKLALVIENCKERFNLSDGDFDEAVKTALWDLLIGRHLAEYEFFLHNFQLPYFTSEEEQSYGKKEIEHLLQESNNPAVLDKIVGIQKMASLPVEFFNQPEIASRLVILFAVQYLVEEKTPYDLQVMVTQFGLPETVYGLIDQEMLLHDDLLGKRLQFFLPLVDSPELLHLFPQTLHEIKNLIIQSLSTSDGLAYRFIQNFLVYKKHAWARENISKALDQPLPARRFLEMHENDKRLFSWTGEPRIGELVKKANRVVSDSIIEELKQTGREGLSSEDRFKGHIL
ncbi:MAG: hypothetical protein NTU97_00190, partial [Candidatus Magasanikbacteria bacterium]|nr:hypothetical protein [Candidatus Magasanikbacteria bacterium]